MPILFSRWKAAFFGACGSGNPFTLHHRNWRMHFLGHTGDNPIFWIIRIIQSASFKNGKDSSIHRQLQLPHHKVCGHAAYQDLAQSGRVNGELCISTLTWFTGKPVITLSSSELHISSVTAAIQSYKYFSPQHGNHKSIHKWFRSTISFNPISSSRASLRWALNNGYKISNNNNFQQYDWTECGMYSTWLCNVILLWPSLLKWLLCSMAYLCKFIASACWGSTTFLFISWSKKKCCVLWCLRSRLETRLSHRELEKHANNVYRWRTPLPIKCASVRMLCLGFMTTDKLCLTEFDMRSQIGKCSKTHEAPNCASHVEMQMTFCNTCWSVTASCLNLYCMIDPPAQL